MPIAPRRKLSYKEARELELLPAEIDRLEALIAEQTRQMQQPDFYKQDGKAVADANSSLAEWQNQLDIAYQRWHLLA